ncbi:MAG: hypothetical protein M1826_006318 [Phylliscum demangeonii]|nr:MAG: hypothetical protein M1826_006318 [Phylliscum demangeonii]
MRRPAIQASTTDLRRLLAPRTPAPIDGPPIHLPTHAVSGAPLFSRRYWNTYFKRYPDAKPRRGRDYTTQPACGVVWRAFLVSMGDTDLRRRKYYEAICREEFDGGRRVEDDDDDDDDGGDGAVVEKVQQQQNNNHQNGQTQRDDNGEIKQAGTTIAHPPDAGTSTDAPRPPSRMMTVTTTMWNRLRIESSRWWRRMFARLRERVMRVRAAPAAGRDAVGRVKGEEAALEAMW